MAKGGSWNVLFLGSGHFISEQQQNILIDELEEPKQRLDLLLNNPDECLADWQPPGTGSLVASKLLQLFKS